ncbi:DUF4168 domain-containing protein [Echinicola sp. CAU 1574]|uniref:DUF4168 domain-containing protein n=1 Tax=Echinicola arenosa TaxID=2774144 RepID=A0ABR9AHT5_9BACT|nr:DUF4168 domain-containing protein [Echinicola arenosa]MBD8488353.1 DUF4168 domain-containing protein [Echinicola arenosa]
MKKLKVLGVLSLLLLLGSVMQVTAQQAQGDLTFTDEDYEKFVDINTEIIPVQQKVQGEMMKVIEEEGLEVARFQELARAQQSGDIKEASEDPEEIAKFNKAGQKVMKMQQEVQTEVQGLILENDFTVQKFQQMSMAYNQDQEVKAKIDTLMDKKMKKE